MRLHAREFLATLNVQVIEQNIMFQKIEQTIGVSEFRSALPAYLKRASERPLVITARRGGEPYVVISAEMYNKLVEAREDAIDARKIHRLVKESAGKKKILWKR